MYVTMSDANELRSNADQARRSFEIARRRMVERIREAGLAGEFVLAAMESIPREIFVDDALAPRAYGRDVLPIGFEQTMSHPEVVAFMTESLQLGQGKRVLAVGTGSGYYRDTPSCVVYHSTNHITVLFLVQRC